MTTAETRQQRRYRARQEKKAKFARPPQKNAFYRAMRVFKERAEALKGAAAMTPLLAKIALMALAQKLGEYKSRGKGRGTPSRNYGNTPNSRKPHQSGQECLRRAVGGWGFRKRLTGLTKIETLRTLAPKQRMRLEDAIGIVRGLDRMAA